MLLPKAKAETKVAFNRDIRPILAEACFHCHGPDPGSRKAGLRLDREDGLFAKRDEGEVVVKGAPDKSLLYRRLITKDADEVMPPPDSHKELKPDQIAVVKRWIEQGAPWQPHWSFLKPERGVVPQVRRANGFATRLMPSCWLGWNRRAFSLHLRQTAPRLVAEPRWM